MRSIHPITNVNHHQSGAVLIVSLVLLLVLTVIGVTSMRSATLEEKMAANSMNYDITFHAAESAIEKALDDETALTQAMDNSTVSVDSDIGDSSITSSATLTYAGPAIIYGNNLTQKGIPASAFDVTGTATRANTGASVTVSQGVKRSMAGS
jgi:type IV pilus assembly protein PilX